MEATTDIQAVQLTTRTSYLQALQTQLNNIQGELESLTSDAHYLGLIVRFEIGDETVFADPFWQYYTEKERQLRDELKNKSVLQKAFIDNQNLQLQLLLQHQAGTRSVMGVPHFYLLTGYIKHYKRVKGMRKRLYKHAGSYLAYYDGDEPAFEYEGNNLKVHLLFEQEQKALEFDSAVNDEKLYEISPRQPITINLQINAVSRTAISVRGRVYHHQYNPDESDSAEEVLSIVSDCTEIMLDSPIFKYQRLEKEYLFGGHYRPDRVHLIDKAFCEDNPDYAVFNNDENNFLALSGDVHNWIDGTNCDLPLFMLEVFDESSRPIANEDERFEVTLNVHAWDHVAAGMLFRRLNEGSVQVDPLTMQIRVYVKNKDTFKRCIEWKANKTRNIWYPKGGID